MSFAIFAITALKATDICTYQGCMWGYVYYSGLLSAGIYHSLSLAVYMTNIKSQQTKCLFLY